MPGHRPSRDDNDVVTQVEVLTGRRPDCDSLVLMVDRGHHASNDPAALEMSPQRDRGMPGLHRTRSHFRQERLIGHIRAGVDDRDLRLAHTQDLLQPPGRVKARVATTNHHNSGHVVLHLRSMDRCASRFVTHRCLVQIRTTIFPEAVFASISA